MAAEGAQDALGPRYAPPDPTLPEPWKGLIDGSTGMLYYWNPESNVTQYEKPAALPPPLPSGPPPVPSAPKLAPIPGARTGQPNGVPGQQAHQVTQTALQLGQHVTPQAQSHTEQMSQVAQQNSSQVPQVGQQLGSQVAPAMQQQLGQQMAQHLRPQMGPSQQIFPTLEQPNPPQQGGNQLPQTYQGGQMGQPLGYPFTNQQMHYMGYQQNMPQQGPPNMMQQPQHPQQFSHQQDLKAAYSQREDADFQQGKQVGFSPSQIHQGGVPPVQNIPPVTNSIQTPPIGVQPGQAAQYGGSQFGVQQPSSFGQLQHSGVDHQQHGPRFQNQMGQAVMHGQQPNVPPVGLKMGFEEAPPGRGGSEPYFNGNNEGPAMAPHQPKLAAIPMARNQPEVRLGGLPLQNVSPGLPGGPNPMPGPSHNMYGHAAGGPPFTNSSLMRPAPTSMTSPDAINLSSVDVYRQKHDVTATGDNVPAPFMSFESTGFPPEILREIHAAGFTSPTPIQAQTWPIALQNRDIVAIAKTGSGKTLGYLIPAFMLLRHCRNNPQNGPTVVVLAPTRELATQIQDEAIKFGRSSRFSCTCLYGGAPKPPQLKELERGADIVVATPGRLNDILEMKKVDFRQVSLLVLDEADRMLDMGFEPQIRKIVNEIPPRRQTLMYTATWPKEVRKIASDLLVNPVQVNIGNADELAANKSITQYVEVVPHMEKQRRVEQILRSQERGSKIIIFCSTKKLCDQLTRSIGRNFGAAAIHGDKSQGERDWVLNQFRSGKSPILVATDVAARGLDIKDVRVVINYDFPTGVEDYVHRIGRTGRAGAKGVAYTFFSEQDWKYAADLIKVLERANQPVPPEVREIAARGGPGFGKDRTGMNRFDSGGGGGGGGGRWDSGGGRGGGMRDGGFGGRGGDSRDGGFGGRGGGDIRDGRFGGRGDLRDGGFGGRGGGMRDGGFGGRGGPRDEGFGGRGPRDGGFGGRGGMRDSGGFGGRGGMRDGGGFGGRGGNRGVGFGGPDGGWDRNERGPSDRIIDSRGRGRGRGRGRYDTRRDEDRNRGRSYSRSPDRVRTWGYSRSRSRSRSRSFSRSRSYSRSRSWSRSRSPRRSRSRSRSRSYSRSPVRRERRRESKFDQKEADLPVVDVPPAKPEPGMSPMSPGKQQNIPFPGQQPPPQLSFPESVDPSSLPEAVNQFTGT